MMQRRRSRRQKWAAASCLLSLLLGAEKLAPGTYWEVSGTIKSGRAEFDPIFKVLFDADVGPGEGSYRLEIQDANGGLLYARQFRPKTWTTTDGQQLEATFLEMIPFVSTASVVIARDPSGIEFGRAALGTTPVTVAITAPPGGFSGVGQQAMSWSIQGSGIGPFTSKLLYSADNGMRWDSLGHLLDTSYTFDFGTFKGTNAALFQVSVSDGLNTAFAVTPVFAIPRKAPRYIRILSPSGPDAVVPATHGVVLYATASDPEDGPLDGAALQWISDIQGPIGAGANVLASLQPGHHVITLKATDSDGNSISTSTSVTMVGGPPTVQLQFAPAAPTGSQVTISVVKAPFGADLSQVKYSLDNGLTWTVVPGAPLTYTFTVTSRGIVHVKADVTDVSDQEGFLERTYEPPVTSITISPLTASLQAGQTRQFTATVTGGSTSNVAWAARPGPDALNYADIGTITDTGLYTAPSFIVNPYSVIVSAVSLSDFRKVASATVTLSGCLPR